MKLPLQTLVDALLDEDDRMGKQWSKGPDDFDVTVAETLQQLNRTILGGIIKRAEDGDVDAVRWLEEREFIKPLQAPER